MTILVIFMSILSVGTIVALVRTKRPVTKEVESSTMQCPYCNIVITGARQLDLINHVACITKSELDIEQTRKQLTASEGDEYFATKENIKGTFDDVYGKPYYRLCAYRGGFYHAVQGILYRNGEQIWKGWETTNESLEATVQTQINLDKHKRRTQGKNKKLLSKS